MTLPTGLPNILTGGFATDDSGTNGGGLTAGTNRTFSGAGNAAQSNSFTGSLAVTVTRVFPNGNMEVAGQKAVPPRTRANTHPWTDMQCQCPEDKVGSQEGSHISVPRTQKAVQQPCAGLYCRETRPASLTCA